MMKVRNIRRLRGNAANFSVVTTRIFITASMATAAMWLRRMKTEVYEVGVNLHISTWWVSPQQHSTGYVTI